VTAADDRGAVLLALVRGALEEALGGEVSPPAEPAWLAEPGASFVTLKLEGELCGCIGSIQAYRPLAEDVRANALGAAFRDPRFQPLQADQLPRLRISVSVLSALEPVEWSDEADLLRRLRPGVDGLVLEHDGHRGTFLPAVWRQLPAPGDFLRQLKRKAGLAPDFWAPDVRVSRYTVESWTEPAA
jgi:AmmeMemoRadiSam system protein A